MASISDLDMLVNRLAASLKNDNLIIPAMPELVTKLSRLVGDSNVTTKELARVIGSDTGVTAQVIRLSQTLRYSNPGTTITSLPAAISRIGLNSTVSMALALANEVKEFGIYVSVMMPGDVHTGFTDARHKSSAGEEVYTGARKAITTMEHDERGGMDPTQMAQLFWRIATCRCPRPQYVGGFSYRVLCFLERLLPKRFVNWIEYKVYS